MNCSRSVTQASGIASAIRVFAVFFDGQTIEIEPGLSRTTEHNLLMDCCSLLPLSSSQPAVNHSLEHSNNPLNR
jgi:hypothetical protein